MPFEWNRVTIRPPVGRWDHITQEQIDAERKRVKRMSDKRLLAYYWEVDNPKFQRVIGHQIVVVRRLMDFQKLSQTKPV
jgi:hypothetical protein